MDNKKKDKTVLNELVVKLHPQIRVIGEDGKSLGIFKSSEVYAAAQAKGLDLMLISDKCNPPSCKILDYKRHKYIQEKSKKARPVQRPQGQKDITIRPNIADGDFRMKTAQCRQFLEDGQRVKVSLRFRGRENAHREIGFEILERFREGLPCKVMQEPKLAGNTISMMLVPSL